MTNRTGIILAIILFAPPVCCCGGCLSWLLIEPAIRPFTSGMAPEPITKTLPPAPTATTDQRAKQLAGIQQLKNAGILEKADDRYMYVWPRWHQLSLDDKTIFAAGVWCYANNARDIRSARNTAVGFRRLVIRDARDAKQLATYCPDGGLNLD